MPRVPTLLIVDDHGPFRASVGRLLAADGFKVVGEASDGETAVKAARQLVPDVILLDIQLPGIDGFETARRVLDDARHDRRRRPVVVLTSSRDRADYGRSVETSGADGFIAKDEISGAGLAAVTG